MTRCCRRQFLAHSAAAAAAVGLGTPRLLAQETTAANGKANMAIARWAGEGQPEASALTDLAAKLTEKAIEALGGMGRFVHKGDIVWIKPNMAWNRGPEYASNTNPDVVAAIVRMCLDAGTKAVKVGDNTCDIAAKAYQANGIAAAAKKAGAEVVLLDRSRVKNVDIKGERLKTVPIFPEIFETDLIINVPVVKHHRLAGATMCMKNYMGVIEKRQLLHQAMADCITDLTRYMKPQICVLDAMRILTDHGPQGGDLADVLLKTTVAAGTDIVALDAFGAELLGKRPADFQTIVKGQEAGLGKMDYRSLALREIKVS